MHRGDLRSQPDRVPVTLRYLPVKSGDFVCLPAIGGLPGSVHVIDEDSILAINAALATARPLLIRGEPGIGKSQLARAAASALGRVFISYTVDSRTDTRDLLWTLDAVARLAEAQVIAHTRSGQEGDIAARIAMSAFIDPGPLWWAFDWRSAMIQAERRAHASQEAPEGWSPDDGVVLLVDEIDKADPAVPNGLLDALGHGRFDVPGCGLVTQDARRPSLVVITTNEERSLPDAFLRRCLVLHLSLPARREDLLAALIEKGRAHFPPSACSDGVLRKAGELLAVDREAYQRRDLTPPGLAEYLDLVAVISKQRTDEAGQIALLSQVAKFALRKHPPEPSL